MGTTLTGLTPATTYDALIKVTDNGPIGATNKLLTDGLGNDSAFYLGTAGVAIKATSVLSFNGPSDTTHSVGYDSVIDGTQLRGQNGVRFSTGSGGGSERMRITSDGNVGIGTSSPSGKLHIAAPSGVASLGSTALAIRDSAAPNYGFDFTLEGVASGDMSLVRTELDVQSQVMTFKRSNGNVGIGTSSADIKLDVRGTIASVLRVSRSGAAGSTGGAGILFEAREPVLGTGQTARIDSAEGFLSFRTGGVSGDINGGAERLRITSAGNVGIGTTSPATKLDVNGDIATSGNIALSAAGGIYFDSGASKYLDDYELGTWTMGVAFGGASVGVTYSSNTGTYTKIGRQVTVNGYIVLTSKGSSTGGARVTGLPFTVGSGFEFFGAVSLRLADVTFADQAQGQSQQGTNTIALTETTNAGAITDLLDTDFANNSQVMVSATYFVS